MQNIPRYECRSELAADEQQRLDAFNRDGYLILENHFDIARMDQLVDAFQRARDSAQIDTSGNRLQDGWRHVEPIRALACDSGLAQRLEFLYGRKPIPFQTLNFVNGSEQRLHCDAMHFSCFPPRFMCAAWVALEDVDAGNGPLVVYPGSHRLPEYQLDDTSDARQVSSPSLDDYEHYPDFLIRQLQHAGYEPKEIHLKKGDVLIWSSNLAHGGAPIIDAQRTRLSHITHYYFENSVYYTPRLSHPYIGRFWLRRVEDVATGKVVPHRYRDHGFTVPTPGLYAFSPNGRPRPVGQHLRYWRARIRNLVRPMIT